MSSQRPDKRVRLTVWSTLEGRGRIDIGKYCLLCPGVRISAGREIVIGDSVMMAQGAFITDSDWHGVYDRSLSVGESIPVHIGRNVWIGDSAIVTKGVAIGEKQHHWRRCRGRPGYFAPNVSLSEIRPPLSGNWIRAGP